MPLFVTVAPGAVVSDNTPIDAALLNLLAQPSVSVIGSVDGGSLALGANSVIANSLASNAVTTAAIADGAVTAAKLASNAVTTAAIADSAVTAAKLGALAVTTAKINLLAVTDAQLAANAVTLAKIAPITAGNIVGTGTGGTGNSLAISSGLAYDATKLYWSPSIAQKHSDTVQTYAYVAARPTVPTANNIADINTSITTTRAGSKILITINLNYEFDDDRGVFILYRNTVEIGSPASPANSQPYGISVATYDSNRATTPLSISFTYLDTVSTATTYAYNLCFHTGSTGNFYLNRSINNTNSVVSELTTSRMILQEFPV